MSGNRQNTDAICGYSWLPDMHWEQLTGLWKEIIPLDKAHRELNSNEVTKEFVRPIRRNFTNLSKGYQPPPPSKPAQRLVGIVCVQKDTFMTTSPRQQLLRDFLKAVWSS